jgi:type I restriction enzyme S subunit
MNEVITDLKKRERPIGWVARKLADICLRISNGTSAFQSVERKGIPVTRIETISSGTIDQERVGYIDAPSDNFERYILRHGDILFSHINSVEKLGNCALYESKPDMLIHGMNLLRLEVNRALVEPYFLLAFLKSAEAKRFCQDNARRAIGQASLNTRDLGALQVPLPSISEQRRIADILKNQFAAITCARKAAQEQLATAKALPDAYLRELFESHEAKQWSIRSLGELCIDGGQYGTSKRSDASDTNAIPVLGMWNINEGELRWDKLNFILREAAELQKYQLRRGDLLFNRTNSVELVGKTAVFDDSREAIFASYLIRFRTKNSEVDPRYVSAYMNSKYGRRFIQDNLTRAIGQANISATTIRKLGIPVPPLERQKKIIEPLSAQQSQIRNVTRGLQQAMNSLNMLQAAILRRAFNGRM